MRKTALQRFEAKVAKLSCGCWIWCAADDPLGYGHFKASPTYRAMAHRWSYEHFIGPIPNGLEIDHLCRHRACVNPEHLEPVTHKVNMERGAHALKTYCKHGHPYDAKNTRYNKTGGRWCLTCRARVVRNRRRRIREQRI